MTRLLAALAVALVALPACGRASAAEQALAETQAQLSEVQSGVLDFRLVTGALEGDQADAGFALAGPFSFESPGDLPVAELDYTQIAGGASETATFVSTGTDAWIVVGGQTTPLEGADREAFAGTTAELEGGLDQLDVANWITEAEIEDGETTDTVTATVDVVALLNDLNALRGAGPVEGPQAERLREAVRSATAVVETGSEDRLLRRLDVRIELADDSLPAPFEGGRFELTLAIDAPNEPVEVDPPS